MVSWRWLFVWFAVVSFGAAAGLSYVALESASEVERLAVESVRLHTARLADEKVDRVERKLIDTENVLLDLMSGVDEQGFRQRWDDYVGPAPFVKSVFLLGPEGEVLSWVSAREGEARAAFLQHFTSRVVPDLELRRWPLGMLKHLHARYDRRDSLFAYQRREFMGRAVTTVLEIDQDNLLGDIFPKTFDALRGEVRFSVVDQSGELIYGDPPRGESLGKVERFPTTLYRWTLHLAPDQGEALVEASARGGALRGGLVLLALLILLLGVAGVGYAAVQAQRLAALKTEFVSNVSHELKTPLSLIRMFAELLHKRPAREEKKGREYVAIIHRESERLAMLIENVLDFARLEKGQKIERQPVSLREVAERAVEALRPRLEQDGFRLVLRVEDTPSVLGDGAALGLVVQNLLDNAAKFSERAGELRVEVGREEGAVWLAVEDDGPGIPEDELPRVFDRFFRGKRRGRPVRGSGIGLSLVQEIARQHGGRVEVTSALGRGSRFVVRLPVGEA